MLDFLSFYVIIKAIKYNWEGAIFLMTKYQCTVCMYIYDPEEGDPTSDIEPGTAFEDLPEDWTCPECGVGKDMFEPLD